MFQKICFEYVFIFIIVIFENLYFMREHSNVVKVWWPGGTFNNHGIADFSQTVVWQ